MSFAFCAYCTEIQFLYGVFNNTSTAISRITSTKGQNIPYHPIINTCIISNQCQIVNKLLQDFKFNFTFCASLTDNCGGFRAETQNVVVKKGVMVNGEWRALPSPIYN